MLLLVLADDDAALHLVLPTADSAQDLVDADDLLLLQCLISRIPHGRPEHRLRMRLALSRASILSLTGIFISLDFLHFAVAGKKNTYDGLATDVAIVITVGVNQYNLQDLGLELGSLDTGERGGRERERDARGIHY